jgi:hypothetical protein
MSSVEPEAHSESIVPSPKTATSGFATSAARVCRELLGIRAEAVEFPGGASRQAVRLRFANGSVIVTRRGSEARAALEANALLALHRHGAPVPRILALDGRWTIQEDLAGPRLPLALGAADAAGVEAILDAALRSLIRLHEAGLEAGLQRRIAPIGDQAPWLERLIDTPRRIGLYLRTPTPPLAVDELVEDLRVGSARFVKWDARPGNALLLDGDRVAWFDWEHCACRNRLDDVAWLLGDEYAVDLPDVEQRLLARHLAAIDPERAPEKAGAYLAAFGTFHMSVRLSLILRRKGDGPWWNWETCLAGDKVGVDRDAAVRLCRRAARWSVGHPRTAPLAPWFLKVGDRLTRQDPVRTQRRR